MADSKENYLRDLGSKRVKFLILYAKGQIAGQICILGMVVNLNALFSCYTVTLCFYGSMTKYPSITPPLHIKKHLKNVDTGTIYIMNHQQLTK